MGWETMNDEQTLAKVRELEGIISRLNRVRDTVRDFSITTYSDAGGALWAGQTRDRFADHFGIAASSYSQISEQIGQAISDCKSKQRSLAFSINAAEHPVIYAQALSIALT